MTARYTVTVDVPRSLAAITLGGFFAPADIAALIAARDAEYVKFRCAPNEHLSLVDIREMAIQSQEAVGQFAAMLASPRFRSRALAFVVSKSLNRLQIQRAAAGRTARFFATVEEARAWLATFASAQLAA